MVLTQRKYALDLLHRANMEHCRAVTTPLSSTTSYPVILVILLVRLMSLATEVWLADFNISRSLGQIYHLL
jgi:hypothetical protein